MALSRQITGGRAHPNLRGGAVWRELAEEAIIGWDFDGEAGRVLSTLAALGSLVCGGVLGFGSQGDVMINELTPEDEEDGDSMVMESIVSVNSSGNETGGRKGSSSD